MDTVRRGQAEMSRRLGDEVVPSVVKRRIPPIVDSDLGRRKHCPPKRLPRSLVLYSVTYFGNMHIRRVRSKAFKKTD